MRARVDSVSVAIVAVAFLTATGCSKRSNSGPATSSTLTSVEAPAPSADLGVDDNPTPAPRARPPLEAAFEAERASRPQGVITVEKVLAALRDNGVALHDEKPHLGAVLAAKYCIGAKTTEDIALSVCEYDSEEHAKKGLESSRTRFASIPNRDSVRNGQTLLIVRRPSDTPALDATRDRITSVFRGLKKP
jgi:hypothetical protein